MAQQASARQRILSRKSKQEAHMLYRLSDNSISGQKHVKKKGSKAFKLKKKDFGYYRE